MEGISPANPRHWFLQLSDIAWGGFYRRFEWHPIAEYDGKSLMLLRTPIEHVLGKKIADAWYGDLGGADLSEIDDFEPIFFAHVTPEQVAMLSVD